MPLSLRLILLAGALLIIGTVLNYIRKKKILMSDSTSWVCIAFLLLFIAIFPNTIVWLSGKLGFQSPANFVFLMVTGLLTVKTFRDSARMSIMRHKMEELVQEVALSDDRRREEQEDQGGTSQSSN